VTAPTTTPPLAVTPPPPSGFRLTRMQLLNWGTFSGVHTLTVPRDGLLIVGNSGSGKSTILDANTALLTPPPEQRFNAAARESGDGARDRTVLSYLRGAWSYQTTDTGDAGTKYLRTKAVHSVVAQEYTHPDGRVVTLLHLAWLAGASTNTTDVNRRWLVAERPVDVMELDVFREQQFSLRALRDLSGLRVFERFSAYQERFRPLLGIDSDRALSLLNKTQSTKNLGDLNLFYRRFMLEPPEAPEIAVRLVTDFQEVTAAHAAVVAAREQIAILRPAREALAEAEVVAATRQRLTAIRRRIDDYTALRRRDMLNDALAAETARRDAHQANAEAAKAALQHQQRLLDGIVAERAQLNVTELTLLESARDIATQQLQDAKQAASHYRGLANTLGLAIAVTAETLHTQQVEVRAAISAADREAAGVETTRYEARAAFDAAIQRVEADEQELASLQSQKSNLPRHMLEMRKRICTALDLAESDLPYLAELIEVPDQEAAWQGAIERVIAADARTLLTTSATQTDVQALVNREHMKGQVRYRETRSAAMHPPADRETVAGKCRVRADHRLAQWVTNFLATRYGDVLCAGDLAAYTRAQNAVTREGMVKRGGALHIKDDRSEVTNRDFWVTGFDNTAKIAEYRGRVRAGHERAAALKQRWDTLVAAQETAVHVRRAREQLVGVTWLSIDTASVAERIVALETQHRAARDARPDLDEIDRRMQSQVERRDDATAAAERANQALGAARNRYEEITTDLTKATARLATVESDSDLDAVIAERVSRLNAEPTLSTLDQIMGKVLNAVRDEDSDKNTQYLGLCQRVIDAFRTFARIWPQDTGGLDPVLLSAPDFFHKLDRLEADDLPRFEERFFNLARQQVDESLILLQDTLFRELNDIPQRLRQVNAMLRTAPFNPGTYLVIESTSRNLPEVREFNEALRAATTDVISADRATVEQRFLLTSALVKRLGTKDAPSDRWRAIVLDAREQVRFTARELYEDGREARVYTDSAGLSGGQKQKLAAICLAAALRYQLGGEHAVAPTFSTVVLDEAFDKADADFTKAAMDIFTRIFGFQMIIATPNKSVPTLDPYVGGAAVVHIRDRTTSRIELILKEQPTDRIPALLQARFASMNATA
jgi:uncharacterized protein YPO0396